MNKTGIRVREFEGAFVADLLVGGMVYLSLRGETKREARSEAKRAAEEMGLYTDGIGWNR